MKPLLLYPVGTTKAVAHAVSILHKEGIPIIDHPAPEVTHLLLDVPSFSSDGSLRGGGAVEKHLERLPPDITVVGGNLDHPALQEYNTINLLLDEQYLARNAAITAECALQIAAPMLNTTFRDTKTLVIGWGRIGKCLAQLLKAMGADVTVAARKAGDRAMLTALGYEAVGFDKELISYGLIYNTVPAPVFSDQLPQCKACLKIDLASRTGLAGEDVIIARGLPGVCAPESSGRLIANRFIHLCREGSK